jgi:hypothetical protein
MQFGPATLPLGTRKPVRPHGLLVLMATQQNRKHAWLRPRKDTRSRYFLAFLKTLLATTKVAFFVMVLLNTNEEQGSI